MIDYFKLLEVDYFCSITEIQRSYYEKIAAIKEDQSYECGILRNYYTEAYFTLIDTVKKINHYDEVQKFYQNNIDTNNVVSFSLNERKQKAIASKIESSIIKHIITHAHNDFENSYNNYVRNFSGTCMGELKEIDKEVNISSKNIYPYFILNYDLFTNKDKKEKMMAKA